MTPPEVPIEESALSADDILSKLEEIPDEEEIKEDKPEEKPEEKEDEPSEEEGSKEEKIDLPEEDDELVIEGAPTRQEILKAFPDIFKKFPTVEKAIYREHKYAEYFPTITDAKEAAETVETFKGMREDLFNGNLNGILKTVKDESPESFTKLTGKLLEEVAKVDAGARLNIVSDVLKHSLSYVKSVGDKWKNSGNERQKDDGGQLEIAVQLISNFLFDNPNVEAVKAPVQQEDPREKEISEREQAFAKRELDRATNEVTSSVDNSIKTAIEKHIDPKNLMTPYVKERAVDDCMKRVQKELREDGRFQKVLDKLWMNSYQKNFDETTKKAIKEALKTKVKPILPTAIQRVRAEALKGVRASKNEPKDEKPIERGKPATSRNSSNGSNGKLDLTKIPKGTSTLDLLNSALD